MQASVVNNKQFFILLGLLGAGAGYLYLRRKDIANAINPVSDKNVFYQAAEGTASAVSGDGNKYALQDWIFGLFNPQALERERELFKVD